MLSERDWANSVEPAELNQIVEARGANRSSLIGILQDVQRKWGWISPAAMAQIANRLQLSLVEPYSVATFYSSLRLDPPAEHEISVCMGTACHVRGAPQLLDEFQRQLGAEADETSSDGRFSLRTVRCLGCCALGPVVVVDGRYRGPVSPDEVVDTVSELEGKEG
ncbi:MAG: NAD(P)H-dependent oxidoreductase subunit E [Candidatus Bipolaricaulota bacterium]